jgi:hypothetical protein
MKWKTDLKEGGMRKIVEAVVRDGERRVPVGLVNVKQALELSSTGQFEFSHPAHEAGRTDVFVTHETLRGLI